MKRQIDNTSPGGAPGGKLFPGSHKRCEPGHLVIRHFSTGDQRIREAILVPDGRKQTDVILLDFSKAFDKVNHSKLLWKLHNYGIRGKVLSWIQAFLGIRSQQVVIDGEESDSIPVNSGVPQGSVLGPILFLTYKNDLPDGISSQVRLFADGTALYLTRVRKTAQHYKRTSTCYQCGRRSVICSSIPQNARWYR